MESSVLEEKVFHKVMKNVPFGLVVSSEGRKRKVYYVNTREFDTLKSKKVPQSLEIGLFFCQIFIFII